MKAVILAGGEGTRLRPLTLERCKPMVPLFGRPVLEHILLLLRRNGISQAAVTLGYLPQTVRDYFGDGSDWGMELHWLEEREPLGTAGGVKQAEDFLGEEDFLVISGDCVCDFDLKACLERHRARAAAATLLVHRERDPVEYGLVKLDHRGRVERFLEKPGWGEVFTSLVNTGIYLLSPAVLHQIPEGTFCDFSRDLFPALLEQGLPLYGDCPYGYWRDIGDVQSYLKAAADALDRKVKLDMTLPELSGGVWSASPLPDSCTLVPPCWIGQRVSLGEHCLIGPHTVLEQGSALGDRTVAQRSVLLGARVGSDATIHGAILCENSAVGQGCTLSEGSVLGAEAALEDDVVLREEVRIWPGIPVSAGRRLTSSVTEGACLPRVFFEGGAIRGRLAQEITPELLLTLGSVLGESDRVALGSTSGAGAAALLMAASAGVSAAGGTPWVQDGSTWGAAAWFAAGHGARRSLFIETRGEQCLLWVFSPQGLPLDPDSRRRIEGALRRREIRRAAAGAMGRQETAKGVDTAYTTAAARQGDGADCTVCVQAEERENKLLRDALEEAGCRVRTKDRLGAPTLWTAHGGRLLFAQGENGTRILPEQLLGLTARILLEQGERVLTLPWDAPAAVLDLGDSFGARVIRPEEDSDLAGRQTALRDGVFAAVLIAGAMSSTGETLETLVSGLPAFASCRRELPLRGSRGDLMEELARRWPESAAAREGLRLRLDGGWAWLTPAADRAALKIRTESTSAEAAAELCDFLYGESEKMDRLET